MAAKSAAGVDAKVEADMALKSGEDSGREESGSEEDDARREEGDINASSDEPKTGSILHKHYTQMVKNSFNT